MQKKYISIITINFNNRNGLLKTIETVIAQTFKEVEYIIIDGGSTDGSVDVIQQYQDKINYWISEKDDGVYDAMNKGIQKATGKYLYFLNSGDCLASEDVLEKVNARMKEDDYDFIYGNALIDNKEIKYNSSLSLYYLLYVGICHQCQFIKKDLFDLAGLYNTDYKVTADSSHLILCFVRYNINYSYIDTTIASIEPEGLSMKSINSNREERKLFLKMELPILQTDYLQLQLYKKINIFERGKNFLKRKFP